MNNIKVSIIIVNYNSSLYLQDCINSILLAKDDLSIEIIIIDNGSTDINETELKRRYPFAKVMINNRNVGYAKACNQGITSSSGEYILLANPDTFVPKSIFEYMLNAMNQEQRIGIWGPKLVRLNGELDPACVRRFPTRSEIILRTVGVHYLSSLFNFRLMQFSNRLDPNKKQEVDCVSGAFMLTSRNAVKDVGLLDEQFFMYFEDIDWGVRFKKAGWKIIYDPSIEVVHYKRSSTRLVASDMIKAFFTSHIQGYEKYISKPNQKIIDSAIRTLLKIKMCYLLLLNSLGFGPWKDSTQYYRNETHKREHTANASTLHIADLVSHPPVSYFK